MTIDDALCDFAGESTPALIVFSPPAYQKACIRRDAVQRFIVAPPSEPPTFMGVEYIVDPDAVVEWQILDARQAMGYRAHLAESQ